MVVHDVRRGLTREDIEAWLVARVAQTRGPGAGVDPDQPFDRYGIDSAEAVAIAGELEGWLGRTLPATLVYDHPTIARLAGHLAGGDAGAHGASARPRRGHGPSVGEPIAVCGMGCRLPGAEHPDALWDLLRGGRDAIVEVPPTRWDARALFDPDPDAPGKMVTRWGGFLADVETFDARFFGISPREAARMDPQQRLVLEVAWEALEDAAMSPSSLAGSATAVFVGVSTQDYAHLQVSELEAVDGYVPTGSSPSIAANRLSYLLDLRGPSVAIDTACSSSLVATHLACQALWLGEVDLAIVGGVNLILIPEPTIAFSKLRVLAADGRCKTFDARADGFVRGEGCGMVVLKPLSAALEDGDPVRAVIRGGAVNNDGRTNGLTAPNAAAQQAVLRAAYARAGVDPAQVRYVEAHGTGTKLGDPIEVQALGAVLGEGRPLGSECAIGSVKTNIGHLEAAAGIAGLMKVVLALEHGEVPASIHFERPNPLIPFDRLPVRVQDRLGPWPPGEGPTLAGVSSFGFGGTNAHVVLESAG